jgi:type VI secretion system protein ImpJ
MSLSIHWHEGLFLQPHHLQRLQHGVLQQFQDERRLVWPYPYGLVAGQLSLDELANFRLRFDRLRVIMPSGLEINYPDNAELPSVDLKPLFAGGGSVFTVFLGLPVWQEKRANAIDPAKPADARSKLIYRTAEVTVVDENTGDNPKPVLVRRYNARFVLEDDDRSDLELVPLLRLVRGVGEQIGQPKLDPEFVPPCLFLNGSTALFQLVRDLVNQIEASRQELVVQVNRGGFSLDTLRGAQFEQVLRLRTLNRYSARLPALLAAGAVPPFEWYRELRTLHAELAALHPDKDDFDLPAYSHENLFHAFDQLNTKVRGLLRGVVTASFLKVDFTREEGLFAAALTEEHFTQPVDYYLGIKSKDDPRAIARLVEDGNQFKFMPRSLATRAIRGVELKEERFPPMQLPAQAGLSYFRLNRAESARVWQQIQVEKAAVLRWPDADKSDFEITLYMTLPG